MRTHIGIFFRQTYDNTLQDHLLLHEVFTAVEGRK